MLLSMLKELRKDLARQLKLQPWVLFSDASLEDMSILYPLTFDELKNCQGVGEGKAKKYGKDFIDLIKMYVEENDITRPDDFVVKSIASKSQNKIYIIQSIDRQMALEDIAEAKGMDMEELIREIETIVATGTRLNLDYYIAQMVDDDVVDELYAYFRDEANSDSVADAIKATRGRLRRNGNPPGPHQIPLRGGQLILKSILLPKRVGACFGLHHSGSSVLLPAGMCFCGKCSGRGNYLRSKRFLAGNHPGSEIPLWHCRRKR